MTKTRFSRFTPALLLSSIFSLTVATAADPPKLIALPTGSTLATWSIKATKPQHLTPVVFLHGGPGMYTTENMRTHGAPFRAAGFSTIYFDQAGGGLSPSIPAAQYSLVRAVDDLEALRIEFKIDKLILWGNSYGADLATLYVHRFPKNVAGLILTSPGAFPGFAAKRDYRMTDRGKVTIGPELTKAIRKIDKLGGGAEATLSQAATGKLMDELVSSELMNGMLCKGAPVPAPIVSGGGNLYANRMLQAELKRTRLPDTLLSGRPVLIVRGACDFLPMANAERYRAALGGTIITIANAGHQFVENRTDLDAALKRFAEFDLAAIE
jgi:pimeloyl-ACP methyl ester carboxylesterase